MNVNVAKYLIKAYCFDAFEADAPVQIQELTECEVKMGIVLHLENDTDLEDLYVFEPDEVSKKWTVLVDKFDHDDVSSATAEHAQALKELLSADCVEWKSPDYPEDKNDYESYKKWLNKNRLIYECN